MRILVSERTIPSQRCDDGTQHPAVVGCDSPDTSLDDVAAWIAENREELDKKAALHGAVLFRGFPLSTDRDFDRFVTAFGFPNFRYEDSLSNAVRINRTPRVFTANEAPPNVRICLHHEMAQTPVYPGKLFFFCEKAAETGGATSLCRSDVLFDRMQQELPEFADECAQKGLLYSHVMPAEDDATSGMGRSWQSTWKAATRDQAEARMQKLGYTWEWFADGCLKVTTPKLPAVRKLDNGKTAFFNQLIAAFHGWKDSRNDSAKSIVFGDGTALDQDTMDRVIAMAEEITFDVLWQVGDVALVDNFVTMHGRRTFEGTRKVLASLVAK